MSTQIFKTPYPKEKLFDLLEKICQKKEKYYLFDMNAYKKLIFYNLHVGFYSELKDYYFLGKHFYLERKPSYNYFTTIMRQICKNANIMFTSQIKYNESKYNIDYFIYV
jgi:hypothetical protein